MEDRIFGLLHHCHKDVLQEGWPLQKTDLFHRGGGYSITVGTYLLNRWT